MSTEPFVIEVNHLVHKYGRTEAVNDLSLRVRRGQCYGFFGRNGAGKTTTIKCLLNLLRPSSGSVRVFGLDPAKNCVALFDVAGMGSVGLCGVAVAQAA